MEVLKKIKNKELQDTFFYDPNWKPDRESAVPAREQSAQNIERFQLFSKILRAIDDNFVAGMQVVENGVVHYKNLSLTKDGREYLKLMSTPINDLVKPGWLETIAKGFVGRLAGVILVPIALFIFNYFFPKFLPWFWSFFSNLLGRL